MYPQSSAVIAVPGFHHCYILIDLDGARTFFLVFTQITKDGKCKEQQALIYLEKLKVLE